MNERLVILQVLKASTEEDGAHVREALQSALCQEGDANPHGRSQRHRGYNHNSRYNEALCTFQQMMLEGRFMPDEATSSGCTALSIVKQEDLMVITNVGDSRVVLGTASDDGAITTVQLIVHLKLNLSRKSLLIDHEFLCAGTTTLADVV
uniref:protein-serine/threonine phosphatase n=1 Tax=Zea mays TaxID=4577 RepID=A0A804ULI8_MAIZE